MSKEEIRETLQAVGIPVAVFCRKVGISLSAWYKWMNSTLNLSAETTARIEGQINKLQAAIYKEG